MSLLDNDYGFDAVNAFRFLQEKEGRALPKKYVLSALKSGDISRLSIPEDLGDDEDFWQIYKFVHAPETLTKEDVHVKWTLDLRGCISLQSLPKGLSVGGYLQLNGCTSLESLPQGLSVGRHLDLCGCTSLRCLPKGLSVDWTLDLRGCISLQSLPKELSVGGGLRFNSIDPIPQRFGGDKNAIRRYIEQELGGKVDGRIYIY